MDWTDWIVATLLIFLVSGAMFRLWRNDGPWPDDSARRRLIINKVAPIFLDAGRPVTPSMISRFMSETAGLSARETGRHLAILVNAEFDEARSA